MGYWTTENIFRYVGEEDPMKVTIGDAFADYLGPIIDQIAREFRDEFPEADKYQFLNTIKFVAGPLGLDLTLWRLS
jgi:hypothetical protein